MCYICDKVIPGISDRQKGEILIEIGLMIRDAELGHFDKAIDTLLDTKLEERDCYEESHWEEEYRNRDEN